MSKFVLQAMSGVFGQSDTPDTSAASGWELLGQHTVAAVLFSLIGIVVFALCVFIIDRVTPFSIRKEIEEDQNTALGIVMGSVLIGVSIIIAAAILG